MDTSGSVALIVGSLTAAIALLGYWNTQHLQRRDRRGVMYAEAMAAMRAFISHDEQVPDSTTQYPYDNEPEWNLCVVAMRRELTFLGWTRRRRTIRECSTLAERRRPVDLSGPG